VFEGGWKWLDGLGYREAHERLLVAALDHDAGRMLIVPCCDPWTGDLIDALAIDPAQPAKIHYLTGHGSLLGNPLFRFDIVRVHQYVSRWLRSPDDLCALRPEVLPELFCGEPRLDLRCDSYEHAVAVRKAFEGADGTAPRVTFDDALRTAA
jgi:hypothetical protein